MVSLELLHDLYQHMEWADARVWTAVLASAEGKSDAKIREYFHHLHLVQRAFLRAWRGESRDTPYPTLDDAPALMLWGRTYYSEAFEQLRTMNNDQLSEPWPLPLQWASIVAQQFGRTPERTTLGETAMQVAMHSTYHRGQINARLRAIGGEPTPVDYIAWLFLGRPVATWPPIQADPPNQF